MKETVGYRLEDLERADKKQYDLTKGNLVSFKDVHDADPEAIRREPCKYYHQGRKEWITGTYCNRKVKLATFVPSPGDQVQLTSHVNLDGYKMGTIEAWLFVSDDDEQFYVQEQDLWFIKEDCQ